jgi:hypothetical protein
MKLLTLIVLFVGMSVPAIAAEQQPSGVKPLEKMPPGQSADTPATTKMSFAEHKKSEVERTDALISVMKKFRDCNAAAVNEREMLECGKKQTVEMLAVIARYEPQQSGGQAHKPEQSKQSR